MKKKHPEHVNHERWLVSYADFITLLFAFFVVLFASGQNDKRKTIKLAEAMQSAFQYNGIFDQHAKTPPLTDDPTTPTTAVASPLMLPVPAAVGGDQAATNTPVTQVQQHIEQAVAQAVAAHQLSASAISVHTSPDGLVLSLREAGFYTSGSADVLPESLDGLRILAAALPPQANMRIEGHTDNIPIHTAQFATNWELSTARAAGITRFLIENHTADPTHIAAAGYAEFHPIATNVNEEGRARNRRVDIVLLK
jgi:chemotaxis protein MotB